MILLLGFKADEDHDCEYQVTGDDVYRIAQLVDHPLARSRGVWCHVTFYCEDLTSAEETNYPPGTRGGDARQGSLFGGPETSQ